MSLRSLVPVLALALLASCASRKEPTPAPSGALPADPGLDLGDPALALGPPLRSENLIVWPVLRRSDPGGSAAQVRYATLDEALEQGKAEVIETGSVNQLALVNHSDQPLLLLSGEVVQGGKQDRILAQDLVVAPHEQVPLDSFCVEHGRWSAREGDEMAGTRFKAAKALAAPPVRMAAQLARSQQEVWDSVSVVAESANAESPTGAYTAVLENDEVAKQVEALASPLAAHLEGRAAVGFVAAIDWGQPGELVAAEVFGDPALFAAYRPKLVRAYALGALTHGAPPPSGGSGLERQTSSAFAARLDSNAASPMEVPGQAFLLGSGGPATPGPAARPDLQVSPERIEAASAAASHLHRTIYKRK